MFMSVCGTVAILAETQGGTFKHEIRYACDLNICRIQNTRMLLLMSLRKFLILHSVRTVSSHLNQVLCMANDIAMNITYLTNACYRFEF